MTLLPLHPETTADPSTVAWYVGPTPPTPPSPTEPSALLALRDAGVLDSFVFGPEHVRTTLAPGRTWAEESARVRDAVRAGLATAPSGRDERDRLLLAAAREVVGDIVGPFARSHGGRITLAAVCDGRVTVHLDGACHGCPAAAVTLRARLERELRARCPWLVGVEEASSTAQQPAVHSDASAVPPGRNGPRRALWAGG